MKLKIKVNRDFKEIIKLAIPIFFSNLLAMAYQFIDMFWLGRVGAKALASVSVVFPIIFLLNSFGISISVSAKVLIGQYKGQKNNRMLSFVFQQYLYLIIFFSILVSFLLYLFGPLLLKIFHLDMELYNNALSYLRILVLANPFVFVYIYFSSILQALGDTKTPMYIIALTVLLNFFLDPLFLFGYSWLPALGIKGVALSTLITEMFSVFIMLYLFFKGSLILKIKFKQFFISWSFYKKAFKMVIPLAIQRSYYSITIIIFTYLVSTFGVLALASYQVVNQLLSLVFFIPMNALVAAFSIIFTQLLGARKITRAKQLLKHISIVFVLIFFIYSIILLAFDDLLISIFLAKIDSAFPSAVYYFNLLTLTLIFLSLFYIFESVFISAGHNKLVLYLSVLGSTIKFLSIYILAFWWEHSSNNLWLAFAVSNVLVFLLYLFFVLKYKWEKKKLTKEMQIQDLIIPEIEMEEYL